MLPQGAVVLGVNTGGVGQTFQTGDTVNGSAYNTVRITETGASAAVSASLNNVARIEHQNVSGAAVNYNEALYTNIGQEWVTKGVAGSTTNLTNASAATTFGVSSGAADALNVAFTAGGLNQTFQVSLAGAGTAAASSTVDYNGAAADINAITVATAGSNNVNLNGTTSVRTVTISGAGNNTIALTGAGALSTTATVTIDASAATGNNVIDIGGNISTAGVTVKGSTGPSTTTLGLVIPLVATLPTITDIQGLQIDVGSNGTLVATGGNTSVTTVTVLDNIAAGGVPGAYTLNGFTGVNSIVYGTLGGAAANTFGALTTGATGAVAVSFAKQNTATIATGSTLQIGALQLNGATSLTINTANGVGATAATTIGAISSNTLTSLSITNASTGNTALNTVTALNAAGTGGVLSTLNLSGIAGTTTVAAGSLIAASTLANGAVITGATLGSVITLAAGAQTGVTAASVTLTGSNTLNTAANTTATDFTVVATDAASNVNTITTGLGNDLITVGAGQNTIDAGAGVNVITLGTHAAAQVDTINITTSGTTSISGLRGATDFVAVSGSGLTSTVAVGAHTANFAAGQLTVANTGAGANAITINNLVAGDNVRISSAGGGANTVNYGTHTAGVVSTIATTAVTTNFTGLITGDTVNAAVAAGTISLGAAHTPVAVNLTAANGAWVLSNTAGDTFNVTSAGASSLALGAHTTGDIVNAQGAALTITNNIAADVINVGFGGVAGNVAVTVGGSSTINANVNAAVVAVTSGTSTINTAAAVGGTYTLGSATTGTVTTFVNADATAQTINADAAGGFVNTITLGAGAETVNIARAANNTTLSGLTAADTVSLNAANSTLNVGTHTGVATVVANVAASNSNISNFAFGGAADKLVLDISGTTYAYITGAGGAATNNIAAGTVGNQVTYNAATTAGLTLSGTTNVVNFIGATYNNDAAFLTAIQAGGGEAIALAAASTAGGTLMFTYSDGTNLHVVGGTVAAGAVNASAIVDIATLVGTTTSAANANLLWQA